MALIHRATLTPTKRELLGGWLPDQPWFTGAEITPVGAYRFDDPAGQVGIEGMLVGTADGSVWHVPLTYRGAPLEGAEAFLVGTSEHSVLGARWVYDACGDPVWAAALAEAVLTGGTQVEELVDVDGTLQPRKPTATVRGSGTPGTNVPEIGALRVREEGPTTVTRTGDVELVVVRLVGSEVALDETLTGQWDGGGPAVLAGVRRV